MTKVVPPLNDRSVLITGCSSGIGHACALGLHQQGFRVFATARRLEDVEALSDLGLEAFLLDVRDTDSMDRVLSTVLARTSGHLAALFNNAGFGQPGAIEDVPLAALRAQFETNVFGTQMLTNRVLPIMLKQGYGRIIHNSSVLGFVSMAYRGAYNASKYALEGLADTLRLELADTPVSVSLIEPGPITSHFRQNAYQKFLENIDRKNSRHALRYESMERRFQATEGKDIFTLPSEAIIKPLVHAITAKRPKARYRVTIPTHAFALLKRILPTKYLDSLLLSLMRQEQKGN